MGETRAAAPLIAALAERYPEHHFLLTHMTPTGRATGTELAARWPGRIVQVYLPYDLPFAVRRFLKVQAPVDRHRHGDRDVAQSAGRSESCAGTDGARQRATVREIARQGPLDGLVDPRNRGPLSLVLAQTEADATRMREIRSGEVEVVGNLKFDYTPDAALVERGRAWQRALGDCPVLLFASTREGEEELLLNALAEHESFLRGQFVALVVPRHPQRFDDVARLIAARGWPLVRRSATAEWSVEGVTDRTVVLGDSMGEMAMYYASCDVACIGGSLLPLGGQNLIEACAVGVPVVVGPHTFNFAQATEDAVASGAAERVGDARAAIQAMMAIAVDSTRRKSMAQSALRFASQHRGATSRTVERIAPLIDAARVRGAAR